MGRWLGLVHKIMSLHNLLMIWAAIVIDRIQFTAYSLPREARARGRGLLTVRRLGGPSISVSARIPIYVSELLFFAECEDYGKFENSFPETWNSSSPYSQRKTITNL